MIQQGPNRHRFGEPFKLSVFSVIPVFSQNGLHAFIQRQFSPRCQSENGRGGKSLGSRSRLVAERRIVRNGKIPVRQPRLALRQQICPVIHAEHTGKMLKTHRRPFLLFSGSASLTSPDQPPGPGPVSRRRVSSHTAISFSRLHCALAGLVEGRQTASR